MTKWFEVKVVQKFAVAVDEDDDKSAAIECVLGEQGLEPMDFWEIECSEEITDPAEIARIQEEANEVLVEEYDDTEGYK